MKLTKKLEAEVLKAYNECWMAYLKGDLKTHASYLSEKFRIIGTSEGEQYESKKGWISYCKKTINQFAGIIQKRKNNIKLLPSGEGVMVIENAHLYVLIEDGWNFYSKIRISALLQKEKTGWKYIHQHGSFPDARANEDEPIATEQIKAENLQLREAVKRKTTELENKNRELEIEAELEKVRTRSLAMHRSDELKEVIAVVFDSLRELGLVFDAASIQLFTVGSKDSVLWIRGAILSSPVFINHPYEEDAFKNSEIIRDIWKAKKTGEVILNKTYSFEEKNRFVEYLGKHNTLQVKERMLQASNFTATIIMEKNSALWTDSWSGQTISIEEFNVLKQVARVFEQAYTRFLDLQKAEAQAREAQIEASLERVRAKAMAMHHSDELSEVLSVLFEQFDVLGISPMYTFLSLIDLEKNNFTYRQTGRGGKRVIAQQIIDLDAMDVWKEAAERWKAAIYDTVETIYVPKELVPEVFKVYNEIYSTLPEGAKVYPEDFPEGMHTAIAASKFGHLGYDHFRPSTEEEKSILLRFNTEFVRLYQRFLDLQKAEAQAREAQIQLSLERVRARGMAMHHSDELNEVLPVLFDQFDILGICPSHATISLLDVEKNSLTFRMTGKAGKRVMAQQVISLDALNMWKDTVDRLRNFGPVQVYCNEYPKDILPKLWELCADVIAAIPEDARPYPEDFPDGMFETVGIYRLSGDTTHGTISFCHNRKPTEEEKDIVGRFATEFGRLYQRFLDLQKAEAQAREAKIETALERIRAKAIGMHHSNELSDVLALLFQQYDFLDIHPVMTMLNLFDIENNQFTHFTTGRKGRYAMTQQTLALDASEAWRSAVEEWKKMQSQSISIVYYPVDVIPHIFEIFKELRAAIPESDRVQAEDFPNGMFQTVANCKFGSIGFIHSQEATEEEKEIVARFAKEFERLYQRFLDLQNAEAQAREAQIEAALERVRSQSMAMRTSEELKNVVKELRKQIGLLGQKELDTCVIQLYDESPDDVHCWASMTPSESKEEIRDFYRPIPKKGLLIVEEALQAYSSGRKDYLLLNEKRKLSQWIDFMKKTYPDIHSVIINTYHGENPVDAPHYWSFSDFNGGALLMVTLAPPTDVSRTLLRRFANVFGLAYRRFVDIKQAEEQARESQIQLALERVRARTMAMQHSDELKDAAALLFQQVKSLGVPAYSCGYNIWEKDEKEFTSWMSTQDGSDFNAVLNIPLTEDANFIRFADSRQKGEQFFVLELRDERMQEHYQYLKTIPAFKAYFDYAVSAGFDLPETQIHHLANFSQGNLLFITLEPCPEFHDVFKRFAAVFDQTYTRFLDLQKAEAQAREAKIEAALEKVRSRTMAMQRSDELSEAASLLFQQVQSLGAPQWTAGYCIFDEDKRAITLWMSGPWGDIQPSFRAPLDENPSFINYLEAYNKGLEMYIEENSAKVNEENYQYLLTLPVVGERLNSIIAKGLPLPTYQVDHCAYFSKGFLLFITYQQVPELHSVFKRFAAVFDQTYTRFLDLQKAEAQARESQIQLALERVRARTMAMQRSDELADVAQLLFQQVKDLGITAWTTGFNIWQPDNASYIDWVTDPTGGFLEPYTVQATAHPAFRAIREARLRGDDFFVSYLEGEQIIETYQLLNSFGDKGQFQKILNSGFQFPTRQFNHLVFGAQVSLLFITYEPCPEAHDIFKRFGKVFEQTYTRFLDLQKAEAQVREAKIEAALEKVRSRSLAMHKSDELEEVLHTLFERLKELDIDFYTAIIILFEKGSKDVVWWLESKANHPFLRSLIPYTDIDYFRNLFEARQNGTELISNCYPFEEKNKLFHHLFDHTDFRYAPEEQKKFLLETEFATISVALAKNTAIHISSYSRKSFSEQDNEVFKRFARVFEQAYTRFLDLQKAEAQAREAQIEVALERTRTQSMLMQHSSELDTTLQVFHQQLQLLGINSDFSYLWLPNEEKDEHIFWATWEEEKGGSISIQSKTLTYALDRNEPYTAVCLADWKSGIPVHTYSLPPAEVANYFAAWQELLSGAAKLKAEFFSGGFDYVEAYMKYGCFGIVNTRPLTEYEKEILRRIAVEFERTYTRFLDLQKAEAQAKEAQIEAALERVRSRAMAMHTSQELKDVALELRNQMGRMAQPELEVCAIHLYDESPDYFESWAAVPVVEEQGKTIQVQVKFPKRGIKIVDEMMEQYHSGKKDYVLVNQGEKVLEWLDQLKEKVPEGYETIMQNLKGTPPEETTGYWSMADFKGGSLVMTTYVPPNEDARTLLRRFANVFGLAYQRFVDLKQAEAQAREAQIEAALERVRSRSMGMQKSEELKEVIQVVYEQFIHLNIHIEHTGFIMDYKARDDMHIWLADKHEVPFQVTIPYFDCAHWNSFNEAKETGKDFFANHLSFEEKNKFYQDLFKLIPGVPEETLEYYFNCPGLAISTVLLENVGLYIENFSGIPYSDEENNTLMRFGKVFQQTYTRFLDLQKAEAQAREAQIEAALERVRSRTMAMQRSEDLADVAEILFKQVLGLGIHAWSTGFNIWQEGNEAYIDWVTNPSGGFMEPYTVDLTTHPFFRGISDAKKRGEDFQVFELSGEPLAETYALLVSFAPKQFEGILASGFSFPTRQINHHVFGAQVGLMFITPEPCPEAHDIFKRFGKVFEQTYTRFLDLQKAEAQAREAKIEAALEKVRSRTMAMQRSAELSEVATVLFQQVKALGVHQWTCGFGIFEIDDKEFTWYQGSEDGDVLPPCKIPLTEHPVFIQFNESRKRGDDLYIYEKTGELQTDHYRYMCSLPVLGKLMQDRLDAGMQFPTFQIDHVASFSHGNLVFITYEHFPEMHDVFKRFAKVFDQTYTRFLDLQKVEAQARETVKQASVDRVRAEIASMRTTKDLERITPLIWNELTTLGVPFIRCGVFIMDEEQQQVQSFLSTPDGKAIAAFRQPYNTPGDIAQVVDHWHKKKMYQQHWNEAQFIEFTKNLVQQGAVTSGEKYLTENRPTDLYLHFIPFLQGMLYAGSTTALSDDELRLMQDLADAFSTAYARYEDFNKLEAAKETVEQTLVDLKQAQQQLVQSEKMASLGELTAGIAHEIQNPLNFVNNFSEVNRELLSEMKAEIEKGNMEEVKAIANDIIGNEEKINHHGKRADAIVKGMLQHSRSTSTTKEPTDINALADEYLRLAYHGLRAKDKSFNASMKTDFDDTIGKINIVPQDIGRTVLNLITNAFYVVAEKKKQLQDGYEPTVTVTTKKEGDRVFVSVKDNGKGIPQKDLEKIFQPFFTTKPTGQGTGLGLSLAYDIVKAHGGEIKVEAEEGEGSEFIIMLPL